MHNGHREQWVSQGVVSTGARTHREDGGEGGYESAVPATAAYTLPAVTLQMGYLDFMFML